MQFAPAFRSPSKSTLPGRISCLVEKIDRVLVETGTMLVTYFDQLKDVPPRGFPPWHSAPQTTGTQFRVSHAERVVVIHTAYQTTQLFQERGLIYRNTRDTGMAQRVNGSRGKHWLTPSSPYCFPPRPAASHSGHGLAILGPKQNN